MCVRVTTRAVKFRKWPMMFWHLNCSLATDRVTRQTREQGVVHVQARRNKGMDNLLTRVAVKDSRDFANVSDMVAGRLRECV